MNQQKFFIITIVVIGITSLLFFSIRYNNLTLNFFSKHPYILLQGNVSVPMEIERMKTIVKSFDLNTSLAILSNITDDVVKNDSTIQSTTIENNLTGDNSLVDTLTKIIISKFKQSGKNTPSSFIPDFLDNSMKNSEVNGKWNISIISGKEVNFTGIIEIKEKNDDYLQTYFIKLENDDENKIDIIQGKNNSIMINGISHVNITTNTFKVPLIIILYKLTDIYIFLPNSLGDTNIPDILVQGVIEKNNINWS